MRRAMEGYSGVGVGTRVVNSKRAALMQQGINGKLKVGRSDCIGHAYLRAVRGQGAAGIQKVGGPRDADWRGLDARGLGAVTNKKNGVPWGIPPFSDGV